MSKVISGTKQLSKNNARVIKAVGGNVKKIRCPGCDTLAHPRPDGKGGSKIVCAGCGRTFKFTAM